MLVKYGKAYMAMIIAKIPKLITMAIIPALTPYFSWNHNERIGFRNPSPRQPIIVDNNIHSRRILLPVSFFSSISLGSSKSILKHAPV